MKQGAMPHLLQFTVFFLLFFLLGTMVYTWISSGQLIYSAIEESSLVYTISTASNALSLSEEGYVRKELMGSYDIEVALNESGEIKTNYFIKTRRLSDIGIKDFNIITTGKNCGSSETGIIEKSGEYVSFYGKLSADNKCYAPKAEVVRNGNVINVLLDLSKENIGEDCGDCAAEIGFSGNISNLESGTFTINLIRHHEFKDQIVTKDTVLATEEVTIEYDTELNEKDDETEKFYIMANVTPVIMKNVDCILIIKQPGELVRFEKCVKGEIIKEEQTFDWYKTQVYEGARGECGPTSTAMAIGWAKGIDVHPRVLREEIIGRPVEDGSTNYGDLTKALKVYEVNVHTEPVYDTDDMVEIIRDDHIMILALGMKKISMVTGDWRTNNVGKHHNYDGGHFVIIKGVEPENNPQYFVVYDPLTSPGYYFEGRPAGKNRWFPIDEVWDAFTAGAVLEISRD